MATPVVVISPRRARPFFARHPWVFAGSVARVEGKPTVGDEVRVISAEGKFIARGLINPGMNLLVRLYRWTDEPLDRPFWESTVESALALRRILPSISLENSALRLVSSEADGISGLTVDRYGDWLVASFTSHALWCNRKPLLDLLMEKVPCQGILVRFDGSQAAREGIEKPAEEQCGSTPAGPIEILENGLRFEVDLQAGQKTGFFLDQRNNRLAAASFAAHRNALDLCCYTGGFALNLASHGQAAHVLGIDSSTPAIQRAMRNALLNNLANVEFQAGDVFRTLDSLRSSGRRFGIIVCDPPKFASRQKDLDSALNGYLKLNRAAVDLLEPGGILVTCSCSGSVDRASFQAVLGEVAALAERPIRILQSLGHPPDHPVSVSCPESEYLKCLIARVD